MKQRIVFLDRPGTQKLSLPMVKHETWEQVLAVVVADKPGTYNLDIEVDHFVGRTFGNVSVRAIAMNGATVNLTGMIRIRSGAQKVDDFLELRVLIVDNESRASAEPKLEIEANDVKASHAAAVGRIDQEQLFYLMSRGVREEDARGMLIEGFLMRVVSLIEESEIKAKIEDRIKKIWMA